MVGQMMWTVGNREGTRINRTVLRLAFELPLFALALTMMAPWALAQDPGRIHQSRTMVRAGTPDPRTSLDAQAVESIRRIAESGEAWAQRVLGVAYQEGRVLPKDYVQAAYWYHKAAERDDALGQWLLGALYDRGIGVPENHSEAARWYRKAADAELALAQWTIGSMYERGRGVPQNDAQAVRWFRKSANQGNRGGQNALAMMYASGRGVAEDHVRAFAWHDLAAKQGSGAGSRLRDKLQVEMTAGQIAEAERLSAELSERISEGE